MDSFPAYFPLAGRRVVIVGSGDAADGKARLFDGSPAEVIRLDDGQAFDPETYRGAALAFIAGDDEAFDAAAAAAAREAGVPVNVVDRPALCDFFTPALVDRGEVVAAVGTGGASPVLAQMLRKEIEAKVPEGAGRVAALLRQYREEVRQRFPDMQARSAFLRGMLEGPAAQAALDDDLPLAQRLFRQALDELGSKN